MALRPLEILPQLALGSLPSLRVNDGRDSDSNPLTLRPSAAALPVAWNAVFTPTRAIRLTELGGLRAVVIRLTFVDRVAQDFDQTALRPTPMLRLARANALGAQPFLDGV